MDRLEIATKALRDIVAQKLAVASTIARNALDEMGLSEEKNETVQQAAERGFSEAKSKPKSMHG